MKTTLTKFNSQHLSIRRSLQPCHQNQSQVRKILNQLSQQKNPYLKNILQAKNQTIFKLKLSKYDFDKKVMYKSQLINERSPLKWKTSTNVNQQFSRNQRVKGGILTGWDMKKANLAQRSYQQPKSFHGLKCDLFSRQFPKNLSKTYSKGFNKKLKQIQLKYENKVIAGNIQFIKQNRQTSIDAIKSKGTRFQLSKDKLFGFITPKKNLPKQIIQTRRNTIGDLYDSSSSNRRN